MDERLNDEIFTTEELESANKRLENTENITLPESLSPQAIAERLDSDQVWVPEVKQGKKKKSMKKKIYGMVAFAATFAIVVTSVMLVKPWEKDKAPPLNDATPPVVDSRPQDYSIIEAKFSDYADKYQKYDAKYKLYGVFNGGLEFGVSVEDSATDENATSAPQSAVGGSSNNRGENKGYGKTNEQVQGVSEADIIKNDGRYIYAVNPDNADWGSYYDIIYAQQGIVKTTNENGEPVEEEVDSTEKPVLKYDCSVSIIEPSKDGKLKKVASVSIAQDTDKDIYYMSIREMYVSNNKLTAIVDCSVYGDADDNIFYSGYKRSYSIYGGQNSITMAVCFDISDKSAPKELWRVYQDGSYVSSRLVNDQLVLLSEYWVDIGAEKEVVTDTCVPEYGVDNSAMARIPCDCIVIGEQVNNPTYLVASTLDIDDKASLKTQAVLGAGNNVYCTTETLYVASTKYKDTDLAKEVFGIGEEVTEIHKFSIKDYDIKHLCCAQVQGHTLNQFSIDEYNGYLRIATTTGTWGESLSNHLYVLDDVLEVVGKVEGIAKGETIKSVRFTGDTGYVVTFEQTDPLFIIDLKDPANPTIKGELKIPGFSAYLHPVSETLLLGVGVDGTNDGQGNGMKISLFDVSDPQNPLEVDKIEFNGISAQNRWSYVHSPAFYDHKALCWDGDEGVMYIPYSKQDRIWASSNGETLSESYTTGVVAIKVDEASKSLQTDGSYLVTDFEGEISRVTYIGDVVLGYSYPQEITSFNRQTQTATDKIKLG